MDYQRHDIRGRAETASASVVFWPLDISGRRSLIPYPYFRDSSWSTLFSVSAERTTQDPVFEARLGQASLQAKKALNAKHSKNLILRYSFQRTNLSNILIPGLVLPQDQQVRLSMVSAGDLHDTRDKLLDAHRGFFQSGPGTRRKRWARNTISCASWRRTLTNRRFASVGLGEPGAAGNGETVFGQRCAGQRAIFCGRRVYLARISY